MSFATASQPEASLLTHTHFPLLFASTTASWNKLAGEGLSRYRSTQQAAFICLKIMTRLILFVVSLLYLVKVDGHFRLFPNDSNDLWPSTSLDAVFYGWQMTNPFATLESVWRSIICSSFFLNKFFVAVHGLDIFVQVTTSWNASPNEWASWWSLRPISEAEIANFADATASHHVSPQ